MMAKHAARPVSLDDRLLRSLFRRAEQHTFLGITTALGHDSAEERALCGRKVEAALRLIHDHDPRRLRRIQRDIDGIFLSFTTGDIGCFHQGIRIVALRVDYVASPSTSAAEVASTIVHEGTHARLFALGFDYAPARRARIEAICHRSEAAFARRLPDAEDLMEQAERRLALKPDVWSYRALQQRRLQELEELGFPAWLVTLLERSLHLRDRIMRLWKGPPPE